MPGLHESQGRPLLNDHSFASERQAKVGDSDLLQTKSINMQIRRRNWAINSYEGVLSGSKVMVLPRKESAGDGVHLANAVLPEDYCAMPLAPFSTEDIPNIGSAPSNGTIDVNIPLTHDIILGFIQFYNDHFGILPHDDLLTRQNRFLRWLGTA